MRMTYEAAKVSARREMQQMNKRVAYIFDLVKPFPTPIHKRYDWAFEQNSFGGWKPYARITLRTEKFL